MANEIDKQLEEAGKSLKPAFKEIVDSLADTNKEVALSAANFRNSSRDSFKGALAAQKVRDTLAKVARGLETGEGQLGDIDFGDFKAVSDRTNQLEAEQEALNQARADRLATAEKSNNVLGKLDSQIAGLREQQGRLQGAALNNATKQLEELEKARGEKQTELLAGFDRDIKENKEALEKEKEIRDKYQKDLDGILEKTNADTAQGLSDFSDGLKELTGFDLIDSFDKVVGKINGVGLLFGRQDLFGDVVGGVQNFGIAAANGLKAMGEGIKSGLSATATYLGGLGDVYKEGGLSAVTEQLNADLTAVWGNMKEGASNMMDGVKAGFGKGVESLKAGFAAFKAGSLKILGAMKRFAMSAMSVVVGFAAATASLIATGVSMLAAALGLSVPALLIGALALLLIGGAIYLYQNSEGFRAAVDTVVEYFMNIIEIIGDIFGGFYDFFAGLFTGDFDRMFEGISAIFSGLWDLIKAPFQAIGDFFRSVFDIDIGQMLRGMAEKILPGWVVNRLFGEKTEPPAPKAMERAVQPNLTSEQIDNLELEEQVKLGYARVTGYEETGITDEEGNAVIDEATGKQKMSRFATFESTDKYQDVLRSEGVTSGGGFHGQATGITAEGLMLADPKRAEELKQEGQYMRDGEKVAAQQAVVTTINNQTTNSANTSIRSVTPTPRDNDPTGSRLAAVPA